MRGLALVLSIVVCSGASAAGKSVAIDLHGRTIEANVVAHQGNVCWLAEADGGYTAIRIDSVRSFKRLPAPVRPVSTLELRADLRREFGREYDVQSAGRHIVVAERDLAGVCARRCDEVHRAFRSYFGRRAITLKSSPYPLATVVVRSQQEFQKRAALEGITADSTLMGYYLRTSNRVLLFDPSRRLAGGDRATRSVRPPFEALPTRSVRTLWQPPVRSIANADLDGTLVHETVHQLAFNTGLHNRTGGNPQWVVEGLATMLEPDEVRKHVSSRDATERINRDRMIWFMKKVRPSWRNGRLAQIVASDSRFQTAPLDAYAEAWSLTFFLAETRSGHYAAYLRSLAERAELHEPTEEERLQQFKAAFGVHLANLEIRWLRFMSQMASEMTQ